MPVAPDHGAGAAILTRRVVLLTNNPRKRTELLRAGVPLEGGDDALLPCVVPPPSPLAAAYMRAKAARMGHRLGGLVSDAGGGDADGGAAAAAAALAAAE